jgi:hypothetical protein
MYQFIIGCNLTLEDVCNGVVVDVKCKSEDKIRTLNWYLSIWGFEKLLPMIINYMSMHLILGDIPVLNWFIDQHELANMSFKYELKSLNVNAIEILNIMYRRLDNFSYHEDFIFGCSQYLRNSYISYNLGSVVNMSIDSLMEIIDWLYERRNDIGFKYNDKLFSSYIVGNPGYIRVLNWLYDHDMDFKDSGHAINVAGGFGVQGIRVLNWFWDRRHEIEFKYDSYCIDYCNHVDILKWWYDRRDEIELKYSEQCISIAIHTLTDSYEESNEYVKRRSMDIIQWWIEHANVLEFKYNPQNVINFNVQSLTWWLDYVCYPLELDVDFLDANICSDSEYAPVAEYILNNMSRFVIHSDEEEIRTLLQSVVDKTFVASE